MFNVPVGLSCTKDLEVEKCKHGNRKISVVLQLQGPQVNPEIGLLPGWTFASSHCIYAGFPGVLQFPSASKNKPIGGLDTFNCPMCK